MWVIIVFLRETVKPVVIPNESTIIFLTVAMMALDTGKAIQMTIAVKSSSENAIALPAQLMAELNLREGDVVKAVVDGQALRIAPLDKFLSLRGALADDDAFDRAMEFILSRTIFTTAHPQ